MAVQQASWSELRRVTVFGHVGCMLGSSSSKYQNDFKLFQHRDLSCLQKTLRMQRSSTKSSATRKILRRGSTLSRPCVFTRYPESGKEKGDNKSITGGRHSWSKAGHSIEGSEQAVAQWRSALYLGGRLWRELQGTMTQSSKNVLYFERSIY